jgi:hypothetical protein
VNPNPAGGAPAGSNARDALNVPSILIMVCGGLGLVGGLLGLVSGGATRNLGPLANNPQMQQYMAMQSGPMHYVTGLLGLAMSGFLIFGALKMRNLESHGLAMGAAIVAMIPCGGCCCIGLPVGIWALITLMKPEIKSQFAG